LLSQPTAFKGCSGFNDRGPILKPNPYTFEPPFNVFPAPPRWKTKGDGVWAIDSSSAHTGQYSIKSPNFDGEPTKQISNATLEICVPEGQAGPLTFYAKASVLPPQDVFIVYVDGVLAAQLVDVQTFEQVRLELEPGDHRVDFSYQYNIFNLDPDSTEFENIPNKILGAVWLDDISFGFEPVPPETSDPPTLSPSKLVTTSSPSSPASQPPTSSHKPSSEIFPSFSPTVTATPTTVPSLVPSEIVTVSLKPTTAAPSPLLSQVPSQASFVNVTDNPTTFVNATGNPTTFVNATDNPTIQPTLVPTLAPNPAFQPDPTQEPTQESNLEDPTLSPTLGPVSCEKPKIILQCALSTLLLTTLCLFIHHPTFSVQQTTDSGQTPKPINPISPTISPTLSPTLTPTQNPSTSIGMPSVSPAPSKSSSPTKSASPTKSSEPTKSSSPTKSHSPTISSAPSTSCAPFSVNPWTFEPPNNIFPKAPWTNGICRNFNTPGFPIVPCDGNWAIAFDQKDPPTGSFSLKSPKLDSLGTGNTKTFRGSAQLRLCKDFGGGRLRFKAFPGAVRPFDRLLVVVDGIIVTQLRDAGKVGEEWIFVPNADGLLLSKGPHQIEFQYEYNPFNTDLATRPTNPNRVGAVWIDTVEFF
jgi:hypothetical protein